MIFEKLKSLIVDQMGVPEAAVTLDASFDEDCGRRGELPPAEAGPVNQRPAATDGRRGTS